MTVWLHSAREITKALWGYYAQRSTETPGPRELHGLAERWIDLKGHLGHRYRKSAEYVRRFVRFQQAQGKHQAHELSGETVQAWARSRSHVHPLSWARENSAVRVFLDHLYAIGDLPEPLSPFVPWRAICEYRPYPFTVENLRRIFHLAERHPPAKRRVPIYRMIYAGALRVSEAVHLKLQDVDLDQGTFFIRKTKFNKDRLLPLNSRLVERLRRYRDEHRQEAQPGDPFFCQSSGRPYHPEGLGRQFRRDLIRLGLYRPTREIDGVRFGSPRIHGLRHAFAVQRLLKWYRDGADVQSKLPLLSTYLGHAHIEHTQVYLKISGVLLEEAHKRFSFQIEKQFPLAP